LDSERGAGPEGYNRTALGVVAICFASIVFDGYDLIVYGTVVPALLEYREWDLTAVEAGAIGSYALIGMLFGAMMVGTITDIVGRRKIMLFCISWFSLFMGLCATAPSPELLGLFRFIAGLGLGGVVPTAIALTIEYAPPHRRSFTNALMFSGYSVGGILAALLAIPLLPAFGWRLMFAIGLAPSCS
jgi:AAHS family benzoate transporter-like MFS transporter